MILAYSVKDGPSQSIELSFQNLNPFEKLKSAHAVLHQEGPPPVIHSPYSLDLTTRFCSLEMDP
jgi:hypothetical protein